MRQTRYQSGVKSVHEILLSKKLPPVLQECREFKAVCDAETPELKALWAAIENARDDQYIPSLTVTGIKRWEKILGVTPKADETFDDRRFRILNRVNESLPFTYRFLENQFTILCGENGYRLQLDHGNYRLVVRVELASKSKYTDVDALLKRVVPANMIIDLSLMYNQHQEVGRFTHAQLHSYTHEQIRSEVLPDA